MTAEIAVLNKAAVALAADSAVTIGRPPNSKIYNTVNKIFELSTHHPVGLMVYGALDFLGMPIETLVKVYRSKRGSSNFDYIELYKDDFIRFLNQEVECLDADEDRSVGAILFEAFTVSNKEIEDLILEDIRARSRYLRSKENAIAEKYFRDQIAILKSKPFAPGFVTKSFPEKYRQVLDFAVTNYFKAFAPNQKTLGVIEIYAGYLLSKAVLSNFRTGIVIVGFGDKELCPALACVEIDGKISGKLKYVEMPGVNISKGGISADILGFAQDDMMKSFLDGIDPGIRLYFEKSIRAAVSDSSLEILKVLLKDDAKAKTALTSLKPTIDKIADDINKTADN